MVRKLVLKNFQSWVNLEVELTAINIIVGETNSGKSAILRALAGVFYNNLEGSGFVHDQQHVCAVEIHTETSVVTLVKGQNINRYLLDDKVFDKMGKAVPEEIQEALRIHEVVFDDDTSLRLQLQSQMDAPFLLSDQGVKATRLLGTVSKAATVYQAARLTSQKKRAKASEVAALSKVESMALEKLRSYDYLDQVEDSVKTLEALNTKVDNIRNVSEAIASAFSTVKQAKARIGAVHFKLANLAKQVLLHTKLITCLSQQAVIEDAVVLINNSRRRQRELIGAISKATVIVAKHKQRDVLSDAIMILENYLTLRDQVQNYRHIISKSTLHRNQKLVRLKVLESELLCPICGQEKKR